MVNNNAYTNVMARFTLLATIHAIEDVSAAWPMECAALLDRLTCHARERADWEEKARAMIVPADEQTGIIEQHDGYFDLPHIDISSIPDEEFPLYAHWSYDRIFRYDMIKQPDVLMFLFLLNGQFPAEQKAANYHYYAPRCIHESSLSPSVHSILAAELGRKEEARDLFRFATRIDLDNYNRNTAEGLHMTSLAAAWMNIVYGFGGLRSDGAVLSLDPALPEPWTACRFRLRYRGATIEVAMNRGTATVRLVDGPPVTVRLRGEERVLAANGVPV
jgi:maltose phosphorylase